MNIVDVDSFIMGRLAKIKQGTGIIHLLGPDETRPKGMFRPPCYAVDHYLPFKLDRGKERPFCTVSSVLSEGNANTEVTVTVPEIDGVTDSYEESGTLRYEVRPYPTPVKLYYQIDVVASNKEDFRAMVPALLDAFPPKYSGLVSGRRIYINMEGDPQSLNQLANPLFRTSVRYEVSEVRFQRQARRTVASITGIRFNTGTQEN